MQREVFLGFLVTKLLDGAGERTSSARILCLAQELGQIIAREPGVDDGGTAGDDGWDFGQRLAAVKRQLGGECRVVDAVPREVRLELSRCPFQEVIAGAPCLCLVTAGVFGAMASLRWGYGAVELEQTMAQGAAACRVRVAGRPLPRSGTVLEFARPAAGQNTPRPVVPGGGLRGVLRRWEENLLRWLLRGGEDAVIEALPPRLRCRLERPCRVLVLSPGRQAGAGWLRRGRGAVRRLAPHALTAAVDGRLAVVVPAAEEAGEALLANALQRAAPAGFWRVGVGGPAGRWSELAASYRQAKAALAAGAGLDEEAPLWFDHLGVHRLLHYLEEVPQAVLAAQQMLAPLEEYDRRHTAGLVRTIQAYLNHQGRAGETARELFIHPTTLRYRLRRAQILGGFDLGRYEDRLWLLLCLRLRRTSPS